MATSRLALLESRIATLEADLADLKQRQLDEKKKPGLLGDEWVKRIYGSFADDADYDKAMELGRQYRESQRPQRQNKGSAPVLTIERTSRKKSSKFVSSIEPKTRKKAGVKTTVSRKR
jgi:hypothetical protein